MRPNLRLGGLFMAAMAAMVAGCSRAKPPEAPAPTNLDQLRSGIETVLKKNRIPGVGVALVTRDKIIWAGGVGKADLGTGRDVTADTMFRIGGARIDKKGTTDAIRG